MTTVRLRRMTNALFGVLAVGAAPRNVTAQTFHSIAAGLNYAGPLPPPDPQGSERYTRGFALQASVGRRLGNSFAVRFDALLNRFAVEQPPHFAHIACPLGPTCGPGPGGDGFTHLVGMAIVAANGLATVDPPSTPVRMYLIAGLGAYYLYEHPTIEGAVRPGISAGAGFTLQVHGRSQLFVEARYHDVLGAPSQPMWLVPLTFGLSF